MNGILVALEPINLGLAIIGVIVGLFVGAMPGLGSVNGVAILLPFTFVIQGFTGGATSPMIFLASIYYGAMYGGAISSITLGIPGRRPRLRQPLTVALWHWLARRMWRLLPLPWRHLPAAQSQM